jgi:hypothetical protein
MCWKLIVRCNWWTSVTVWLVAALWWCKPQCASCMGSGGIPHALTVYQYSQQQHTVFTSTHSHPSPVDSLDVLRVTVLLCVQRDTHRCLWNREGQWAKLSTDRRVPAFWRRKKYLQYQKQPQHQYRGEVGEPGANYRPPRDLEWGPEPLIITYKFWSFSQESIFVKIHLNKFILNLRVIFFLFSGEICSWTTILEGPEKFFQWVRTLSRRHRPKLPLLMWICYW